MLGSIYVGLSGMTAFSDGLKTISNNVSNLNTPGFKTAHVSFSEIFHDGQGGLGLFASTVESGGVRMNEPRTEFRQGDLRATSGDLDLAIDGAGFLVLLDGDKTRFTRTGQFVVGEDGFIELTDTKERLAMLDGAGLPAPIHIDANRIKPPVATTKIEFADNLSSTGTEANVSNISVFNASGEQKTWQFKFTRTENTSEWNLVISDDSGAEVATQKVRFISSVIDPQTATLSIIDKTGALSQTVTLDFSRITSFSTGTISTIRTSSVDGAASGTLTSVTIDDDGRVKLAYSNGDDEVLGAVALAEFRDPQRLQRLGSGLYELPNDSISFRYLSSEAVDVGKVVSRQIEASNVDLAQQFGDLILIQRGFQASSQVVSVTNEMIQQLFGMRGAV